LPKIEKEIIINSSTKKVWTVIVKHLENPQIQGVPEPKGPIRSVIGEPLSKQRKGIGTKTRWIYQLKTRKFVWDDIVTSWEENKKITWEATSAWDMIDSFILSSISNDKTLLRYVMDYSLPYGVLGRIYDKLFLRNSMEAYLEDTLERMKRIVEKLL
jgi:uncharacterized membrane protein